MVQPFILQTRYDKRCKPIDGWRSKLGHLCFTHLVKSPLIKRLYLIHILTHDVLVWKKQTEVWSWIHVKTLTKHVFFSAALYEKVFSINFLTVSCGSGIHFSTLCGLFCTICTSPLTSNCCHPWIHRLPQWQWLKVPLCAGCLLSTSVFCCFFLPFTCVCVVPLRCP